MEMGHVRTVTLFIRPSLSALQFGMGSVKLGSVASKLAVGSLRKAIHGRTQRGQATAHRNQVEVPLMGQDVLMAASSTMKNAAPFW